jgi:hypothetical protein
VRDDWETMSDPEGPNGLQPDSMPEGGILTALPRARPQRASPRRAAARTARSKVDESAAVASAGKPKPKKLAAPRASRTPDATKTPIAKPAERTAKSISKPAEPPAPKQGYEPEDEVELGTTVNPPSGAELVESVADIVGELANSGLAAGGRLLKDAFSLLRRP